MFDAKRLKLLWLLAICGMLLDGPIAQSIAQEESSGGFRSAMNRFLGVRSRAQSQGEQGEDQDVDLEEPDVELQPSSLPQKQSQGKAAKENGAAPQAYGPRNVRAASGQKGLFSGGLFHQLRSVTAGDDEVSGDDVQPSSEEPSAPASRQSTIEPFSKPAVPPSAAYGSAAGGRGAVGTSAARNRNNGDLPKIVRPQEYLNRNLPSTTSSNQSSSRATGSSPAITARPSAPTQDNVSGLGVADINTQQESLDNRKSSRRPRTSPKEEGKIVGATEMPQEKLDDDLAHMPPLKETRITEEMPTMPPLEIHSERISNERIGEAPAVSRQAVDRDMPRPEFTVTSRQSSSAPMHVAQAPDTTSSTAAQSKAESKTLAAPLPDPISLPPSSSHASAPASVPASSSSHVPAPSKFNQLPSETSSSALSPPPSVAKTNTTATKNAPLALPPSTTVSAPKAPPMALPPSSSTSSTPAPKVPAQSIATKPSSAPSAYSSPENFNSPLKDLANQSKQSSQPKSSSVPPAAVQSNLPNSLYSQVPNANASGPAAKVAQNNAHAVPNSHAANAPAAHTNAPTAHDGALMEMTIPQLELWVEGPDKLRVEKPATYRIFAKNAGQNGVVGLMVSALIPAGVTAKDMKGSAGTLEGEKLADASQSILWQLPELPPGQVRELSMELSAVKPENFGLEIEWAVLPQSDVVQLQSIQPQLLIGLEGPSEVMYGKPETYKLHVRNPGNAPVEDVDISLAADSFGTKEAKLGTIASGDERTVEVELTFKQGGELSIVAGASSAITGLTAKSDIKVHVSQVKLESACRIPEKQYQGAFATYVFSVENVGDVATQQSVCEVTLPPDTVVAELPAGVQFVNNKLVWDVGALKGHSENTVNVELQLNAIGDQPLAMFVKNDNGDHSKCEAMVSVESISDLKLTVVDPVAPAPVSENVKYELVIHNRGARPARDVAVVAQFSDGIEPVSVSVANAELVPGQVVFQPIAEIGPGEKVSLVITASASSSGMHRFRAEVQCDGGETHLVQEESTRFLTTAARVDSTTLHR